MRNSRIVGWSIACVLLVGVMLTWIMRNENRPTLPVKTQLIAGASGISETDIVMPGATAMISRSRSGLISNVITEHDQVASAGRCTTTTVSMTEDLDAADALVEARTRRLDELTSQIKHNPDITVELIRQIWQEEDSELIGLLVDAILQASEASAEVLPVQELLEHARSDSSPARRSAALRLLSRAPELNDSMLQQVAELASTDPDKQLRFSAISTMNSWMIFHRDQGEKIASIVAATREMTDDPVLRGISIQAIANQDLPLKGALLESMVASLNDSTPMNRALAALGLARGITDETHPRILQELSRAYERETEMYVRRNMIGMMVLGGGKSAVGYLTKLSAGDPMLYQDIQDYLQLLQSHETSMEALISLKERIDDERGTTNHLPQEQFFQSRQL